MFFDLTFQARDALFKSKLSTLNQTSPTAPWKNVQDDFAAAIRKPALLSGLQNTTSCLDSTAQLIRLIVPYLTLPSARTCKA